MNIAIESEESLAETAYDIDYALEGHPTEFNINVLSLLLARYIMQSEHPLMSYNHSRKIVSNSIMILKGKAQ